MDYEKKYTEAVKELGNFLALLKRNGVANDDGIIETNLVRIFPELAESEDERIRKFLLDYAVEMIAGLESDISRSTYNGIKGHDPESEAELAQWQKARAYLEKLKQTKQQ